MSSKSNGQCSHLFCGISVLILFMFIAIHSGIAWAECSLTFSWSPNPESYVAGYNIYYGTTQGGPYNFMVDANNPTPVNGMVFSTVNGLIEGNTYYFVATAYDANGNESEYCTEVSYSCPDSPPLADTIPPSPPTGLGIHY